MVPAIIHCLFSLLGVTRTYTKAVQPALTERTRMEGWLTDSPTDAIGPRLFMTYLCHSILHLQRWEGFISNAEVSDETLKTDAFIL